MSSRIRYKETSKGVFESVKTFTSSRGVQYKVRIDLNEKVYAIKNLHSENLIKGGEGITNLNVLKQSARDRLESLGVSLTTEKRNRTFGKCEKGYSQSKHESEGE